MLNYRIFLWDKSRLYRDLNFENVPIVNDKMASKKVFDLIEAEDRKEVTELLTNTAWTSQDLEEKHGVRSVELFLRLIIQLTWDKFDIV